MTKKSYKKANMLNDSIYYVNLAKYGTIWTNDTVARKHEGSVGVSG